MKRISGWIDDLFCVMVYRPDLFDAILYALLIVALAAVLLVS